MRVDSASVSILVAGDSGSVCVRSFVNLVGNAIKFTSSGEVTLSVQRESQDSEEDMMVRVTVKDSGIGIPLERRKKIFSAFTQADSSTTRKYGGTGLGLTISRRLTELLGRPNVGGKRARQGQFLSFHREARNRHGNEGRNRPAGAAVGVIVLQAAVVLFERDLHQLGPGVHAQLFKQLPQRSLDGCF